MDQSIPTAERANMSYNDLPVYRLAEAYLIFAEAKAELNVLTQDDVDRSINLASRQSQDASSEAGRAHGRSVPRL